MNHIKDLKPARVGQSPGLGDHMLYSINLLKFIRPHTHHSRKESNMQVYSKKADEAAYKQYIQENKNNHTIFVLNITTTGGSMEEITLHGIWCGNIQRYAHVSADFSKRIGGKEELQRWAKRQSCGLKECPCIHEGI